jgi:SAM-dependent methyltransferase
MPDRTEAPPFDRGPSPEDLVRVLSDLYQRQLRASPKDEFLRVHCTPRFVRGTVDVFRFYRPYLPAGGTILDWGCRHAPDSCLIRATFGQRATLYGCDFVEEGRYAAFHDFSGLHYDSLREIVKLPYASGIFDTIVASGVLEHVPMDYESLKELYRVLKPGGRLVVTYLPNRASAEEWYSRRRGQGFHNRLYGLATAREMMLHTGFRPVVTGFQSRLDLLAPDGRALGLARPLLRAIAVHRLAPCLCVIAEKVTDL